MKPENRTGPLFTTHLGEGLFVKTSRAVFEARSAPARNNHTMSEISKKFVFCRNKPRLPENLLKLFSFRLQNFIHTSANTSIAVMAP